jgi:hypothetical protein
MKKRYIFAIFICTLLSGCGTSDTAMLKNKITGQIVRCQAEGYMFEDFANGGKNPSQERCVRDYKAQGFDPIH